MNDIPEEPADQAGWVTDECGKKNFNPFGHTQYRTKETSFFKPTKTLERKWLEEMFASTVRIQGYESAAAHLFDEIKRSAEQAKVIPEWPESAS